MAIDRNTVLHVARLARLTIDDGEIDGLTAQMSRIVAFVEQIEALDTSTVPATAHVLDAKNVLRADGTRPSPAGRDEMLALAPQAADGFIVVPRVIE